MLRRHVRPQNAAVSTRSPWSDGAYLITKMDSTSGTLRRAFLSKLEELEELEELLVDILDAAVLLAACAGSARETWYVLGTCAEGAASVCS